MHSLLWTETRLRATKPVMKVQQKPSAIERAIYAIGSIASLVVHTILFIMSFLLSILGIINWQLMLLVLTTIVSLEAIYLAIFIQISVNRNTAQLREVEEDIDEIQEDFEDIQEDIEEMSEDIEEMSEDIDEIQEDVEELNEEDHPEETPRPGALTEKEVLHKLAEDMSRMAAILDQLKGKQ